MFHYSNFHLLVIAEMLRKFKKHILDEKERIFDSRREKKFVVAGLLRSESIGIDASRNHISTTQQSGSRVHIVQSFFFIEPII